MQPIWARKKYVLPRNTKKEEIKTMFLTHVFSNSLFITFLNMNSNKTIKHGINKQYKQ